MNGKKGLIGIIIGIILLVILLVIIGGLVIPAIKKLPEAGRQTLIEYRILPEERYNISTQKAEKGYLELRVKDRLTNKYQTDFEQIFNPILGLVTIGGIRITEDGVPVLIEKLEIYKSLYLIFINDVTSCEIFIKNLNFSNFWIFDFSKDNFVISVNATNCKPATDYWAAINTSLTKLPFTSDAFKVLVINTSACGDESCGADNNTYLEAAQNLKELSDEFNYVFITADNCSKTNINTTATFLGINLTTLKSCPLGKCYSDTKKYCIDATTQDRNYVLDVIVKFILDEASLIKLRYRPAKDIGMHNITITVERKESSGKFSGKKTINIKYD